MSLLYGPMCFSKKPRDHVVMSLNRVKLHQTGSSVSPCLWFERWEVRLMDDASETDKEGGWQRGLFKEEWSLGAERLCPALQLWSE